MSRSGRQRRPTSKLFNYFSGFEASSAGLHLSDIPQDFSEITGRPDSKLWLEAVDSVLKSMDLNKFWNIVPIPPKTKLLKSK